MYLGLLITFIVVFIMYFSVYRKENGIVLASMVIIGAASGISFGIKHAGSLNVGIKFSESTFILYLWAFALLFLFITINTKGAVFEHSKAVPNKWIVSGTEGIEDNLPDLMTKSFEAFSENSYENAINFLEEALSVTKDLQTELKVRTELAFAYQLMGQNDLTKEQLKAALELAEKLGDNWVDDITAALKELTERNK